MNIALVVYSHYSRDARVRRYAESMAGKGFKIDVISLNEDYKPRQKNISLIQYPLPRRRFGRFWYIVEYFLFFIYSTVILTFNHLAKRYSIIHINNMPEELIFAAAVPKLLGAKVILDMHDPMPELYQSKYKTKNGFIVRLLKWLEKWSMEFADQVLTANEEFKSIFLQRSHLRGGATSQRDKISVILNCPDPRIFKSISNQPFDFAQGRQLTINNHHFTLFYMGTIEERFGLDIVIEALPRLLTKIPNIKFVIIPKLEEEGEYFENLELRIKNSELRRYIQIFAPLPLEKIAEKLKEADVGIVLAKNGVFTENIFPVKLLEFVQMNIPVIATKTKVLSKYFNGKQIYFLQKNTPAEFSKAVIDLYKSKKLRQSLTQNAKKYLKKYNWPKEEKKYFDIIDSIATPIL